MCQILSVFLNFLKGCGNTNGNANNKNKGLNPSPALLLVFCPKFTPDPKGA